MIFLNSREDDSEARRALSSRFRKTRRQRITANIYISFLSWFLEFILGNLIIIFAVIRIVRDDVVFDRWFRLLDKFLLFVLLPCTYLLNNEKTKEIIVSQNWYRGIRSIFLTTIQVSPTSGPDPPAQPRNASVFDRNVKSSEEAPERIPEEEQKEEESPDPKTPPSISAQPSDTQPSTISTRI